VWLGSFTKFISSSRPSRRFWSPRDCQKTQRSAETFRLKTHEASISIEPRRGCREVGTELECLDPARYYHNEKGEGAKSARYKSRRVLVAGCVITRPGNTVSKLVFYYPIRAKMRMIPRREGIKNSHKYSYSFEFSVLILCSDEIQRNEERKKRNFRVFYRFFNTFFVFHSLARSCLFSVSPSAPQSAEEEAILMLRNLSLWRARTQRAR
jgi:hypothetical protein